MKYYYSVEIKDFNNTFDFDTDYKYDLDDLAEQMAKDYVDCHDGWEMKDWPYCFYIWDEEEKYLGCVTVHQEYTATYYGYKVKE